MNTLSLEYYSEEARDSDKGISIEFLDSWKSFFESLQKKMHQEICVLIFIR